jgi:hypothetical protein
LVSQGELSYGYEAESSPWARFLQVLKRLPPCYPVWAGFVRVDRTASCLFLELGHYAGVLEGNIEEIDAVAIIQQLVRQPREDRAVQAAGEQYGNPRVVSGVIFHGRLGDVPDTEAK